MEDLTDENSYMYLALVPEDSNSLRRELPEFVFNNPNDDTDLDKFYESLKETMVRNNGFGLSANQVGWHVRMFIMGNPEDPENIKACVNPKIVSIIDDTMDAYEEGCLSFPNLVCKVKRPKSIRVRYQDTRGETHSETLSGLSARIFQHETDHLNGILFTDRASRYHVEKARKNRHLLRRKMKRYYTQTHS